MDIKIVKINIVPQSADRELIEGVIHFERPFAFASFTVGNAIYLGNIAVYIRSNGGYRLEYPNQNNIRDSINTVYPASEEVSMLIEESITRSIKELITNKD